MQYFYEDLSPEQFEKLVLLICQKLLGISVQGFSKGPDGGRDAKFEGTAELHPSQANPWTGITIIQAKHTNGHNKYFSETDFFSKTAKNTIIGNEISKVNKLRENEQINNYMLFANRRLSGNAESDIKDYFSQNCKLPSNSIYLCGIEQIEILLKSFPDIAIKADLDPIDSPLIISPEELSDIIQELGHQFKDMPAAQDIPPSERISFDKKNELNNMSPEYAKLQLRTYLKNTEEIKKFLESPDNFEILNSYESVVIEFESKIIAKRKDFQTFDCVMEYLVDQLFNRDPILRQRKNKRLTRLMLFYMYWNCDIGLKANVTTN